MCSVVQTSPTPVITAENTQLPIGDHCMPRYDILCVAVDVFSPYLWKRAPLRSSSCTTLVWPSLEAKWSGVMPRSSPSFRSRESVMFSNSLWHVLTRPYLQIKTQRSEEKYDIVEEGIFNKFSKAQRLVGSYSTFHLRIRVFLLKANWDCCCRARTSKYIFVSKSFVWWLMVWQTARRHKPLKCLRMSAAVEYDSLGKWTLCLQSLRYDIIAQPSFVL